jgi:hypothetical protein
MALFPSNFLEYLIVQYIGWIYTLARNTQIPNRDFMLFLFSGFFFDSPIPFLASFSRCFSGKKSKAASEILKIQTIEESVRQGRGNTNLL